MEYVIKGKITLRGVDFIVDAGSRSEAIQKANAGQYVERIIDSAECTDWEVDEASLRENV